MHNRIGECDSSPKEKGITMDELIRQIYGGFDRFPADLVGVNAPYYNQARDKGFTFYNTFKAKLPSEQVEEFDKLMDSQLEVLTAGMEEGFVDGFKLGARLMIEIFTGQNQEF